MMFLLNEDNTRLNEDNIRMKLEFSQSYRWVFQKNIDIVSIVYY